MRVDTILLLALTLAAGGLCVSGPWPVVLGAALVTLLLAPWVSRRVLLLAWLGLLAGFLRATVAVDDYRGEWERSRRTLGAPKRCAGVGRLSRSPTLRGNSLGFVAYFERLECGERVLKGVAVRLYGGPSDLARGDRVEVVAQLAPTRVFRHWQLPDPYPRAARSGVVLSGGALAVTLLERGRGVRASIDRARAHARQRIARTFAPDAAPLARALVLGETDLAPEEDHAFKLSGLAHLLAVSGTHLVFAVVGVVRGLGALLAWSYRLASCYNLCRVTAGFGIVFSLLYADFAGGSGSAWRAAFMLSAAYAAVVLDGTPQLGRALGLSILVGVVVDPLVAFDISFLLSAAATAGLMIWGRPWTQRLRALRHRWLALPLEALVATMASMLLCAPLLALLGDELSWSGLFANVVAAPIGELFALPVCLAHPLLSWAPPLERSFAWVGSGALLAVRSIALGSARLEWTRLFVPSPNAWQLGGLVLLFLGWVLLRAKRRWLWVLVSLLCLGTLEWAQRRSSRFRGGLGVTALDIGQGDATLVDLPGGALMLVDGGGFVGSPVDPGKRVILPLLRARRRKKIDVVVLTHPHPDHFGGLLSVAEKIPIGAFWDTGQGRHEGAGPVYEKLIRVLRKKKVPILGPRALCPKSPLLLNGARVDVLAPCPDYLKGHEANDNSFVIRIRYGQRAVLLTGDAERELENRLLKEQPSKLSADLLKVGHHGSRTSTSRRFLRAVGPRWATISCGVRNRFGHPHDRTLNNLRQGQVKVARIDELGAVSWWTDGEQQRLFRGKRW